MPISDCVEGGWKVLLLLRIRDDALYADLKEMADRHRANIDLTEAFLKHHIARHSGASRILLIHPHAQERSEWFCRHGRRKVRIGASQPVTGSNSGLMFPSSPIR